MPTTWLTLHHFKPRYSYIRYCSYFTCYKWPDPKMQIPYPVTVLTGTFQMLGNGKYFLWLIIPTMQLQLNILSSLRPVKSQKEEEPVPLILS